MSDEEELVVSIKKKKNSNKTLENRLESQAKEDNSETSKSQSQVDKEKNENTPNLKEKSNTMTVSKKRKEETPTKEQKKAKKTSEDSTQVNKSTPKKEEKNSGTPRKAQEESSKGRVSSPKTTSTPNKKRNRQEEEESEVSDEEEESESETVSSEEEEEVDEDEEEDEEEQTKKKKKGKKGAELKDKKHSGSKETKKNIKKESKIDVKSEKKKRDSKKDSKKIKNEKKGNVKKEEEPQYKWWLEDPLPPGKKWKTLEHNGVLFPPPYEPHGVPLIYDGKKIQLLPEQEEIATYFAQYLETDHVKKPQFVKNFFDEFQKILKKTDKKTKITDFKKCDFSLIHQHLMEQREKRRNRTKEEKQVEKEEREQLQEKYGYATVDGYRQKIANYRIEPPGLFLGRGDHPKAGMLKKRITPEDVTLNMSKDAAVPECPIPGHKWGKIIHNDEVSWLAFWKDNINDSFKYVWLAPSSRVKGEADMKKFETARNLKNSIDDIRKKYTEELKSKDMKARQRATALYVIDHLALRVGNEKDEDQADTVGCCSLRVEHIKLHEPNVVEFDFLGKDSMRYQNKVEVDDAVFKNFRDFCKKKKPKDELFDQLTTTALNAHLKQQMEGLTAKVFRTFNASITLERELKKVKFKDNELVDTKMLQYNRANREVAILCNHQKSVSKNFKEQVGKIDEKIQEIDEQISDLKDHLKAIKSGKPPKKKKLKGDDEKIKKLPDDPEKVRKQIAKLEERKIKWDTKKTEKDELKTVSLTTSKINYLDPRISVAWAKKNGVPVEKIFSKTLREKFPWAMDVDEKWKF